jgi:hypothetical protein
MRLAAATAYRFRSGHRTIIRRGQLKHIEISVINPEDEQQALLEWAAHMDAGQETAKAKSRLSFSSYGQWHAVLTDTRRYAGGYRLALKLACRYTLTYSI